MAIAMNVGSQPVVFADAVEEAVRKIVSFRAAPNGFSVSVPVSYPNGNFAALHVSENGGTVLVTDQGLGRLESEYFGADLYFDAQAQKAADAFGVAYDGYSLFALKVPLSRIDGALAAVANASVRAAASAIQRASEIKARYTNEQIFDRLVEFFGARRVEKHTEIQGAHDRWEVHNVVSLENRLQSVFEFVAGHQASIAAKFYMFSDLKKTDQKISLCSVVEDMDAFRKAKSRPLADISNVVPFTAPKEVFEMYAGLDRTA
jgi:hypothetical protein